MKKIGIIAVFASLLAVPGYAGNEDRVGSAGATELLINPWARSAGWGDVGISSVTGLEATYINVAGLAFTPKTELGFVRTNWLAGSGIKMNSMGLAQRIGETSVLGLSIMTMNFGDLEITTPELPEGGIGTFSPRYFNIGLSYAKEFSKRIYGGITVKAINQSIANARSSGVAFDAGIRYVAENDKLKFGITLKNVGPPMSFTGDGFSVLSTLNNGTVLATEQRSANFEMPSQLSVGLSYDFLFGEQHKLVAAGAFTSNSFSKDQFRVGVDYGFTTKRAAFNVRAGYVYEKGIFGSDAMDRTTALTGPTAGVSVDLITGEKQGRIGLDYTYRATNPFNGVHSIGLRIDVR